MKRHARLCGALALLAAAVPLTAGAQSRGRTDGPEESEYGKGGYGDNRRGLSLQLDWGAAINSVKPPRGAPEGPPLFVGATLSLWGDDWYQLDASAAYVFDGGRFIGMIGPTFRTWGWPLTFTAGLKAGAIVSPKGDGLRFGISPQVGAEFLLGDSERIVLGLHYSPDIPIGGDGVTHRLYMNVGYRF
ncbi:hypothetical protein DRW03_04660 [Corallococcus sp. H22C18031201]|uniref:hypothetical protein n=1 Tax=Citreicoccus inhibens TaxID=2849499 RepID=UPI000E71F91D|nr:hypothetical protein [Citreicoccus inhibens]MBU8899295.1 hypothetical protein [Citreicoccus inhibens]RJS25774.1 hypothetical protein DRW03_04660 [Corallococcus sp. H22C18031201]